MRALVCSGGGVLGAYEVGALRKWMRDDSIQYDILTGISVGAINTAYLAQFTSDPGSAQKSLEAMWAGCTDIKVKQVWWGFQWLAKLWSGFGWIPSLWKPSVYDSSPLRAWLDQGLDVTKIESSGKILRVVAVCWDSWESYTGTEKDPLIKEWVKASCAFPCMLEPVTINGVQWMDGGVRSQTPLGEAIRAGADEIDVIMTGNSDVSIPWKSAGQAVPARLMRTLDIFSDQIMRADLRICGLKNDLSELKPEYKKIKIRLLQPSAPLAGDLDFDSAYIQTLMQIGYEDACKLG